MRFDLKKPCPQCPFKRSAGGFLTESRAREIAESILHGNVTFTCHKTITGGYDDEEDDEEIGEEDNNYRPGAGDQHCAGALAMYDKLEGSYIDGHRHPVSNQMLQIAERLRLRDRNRLDPKYQDEVYDSVDEMGEAHLSSRPATR